MNRYFIFLLLPANVMGAVPVEPNLATAISTPGNYQAPTPAIPNPGIIISDIPGEPAAPFFDGSNFKERYVCSQLKVEKSDFFTQPGIFPSMHYHTIIGNTGSNKDSTKVTTFTTGGSTCSGWNDLRSAIWEPTLYNGVTGDIKNLVNAVLYYSAPKDATKATLVKKYGDGLQMIAGNTLGNAIGGFNDKNGITRFQCLARGGFPSSLTTNPTVYLQNCQYGSDMQVAVKFPECWDGVTEVINGKTYAKGSANHKAHMAYSSDITKAPYTIKQITHVGNVATVTLAYWSNSNSVWVPINHGLTTGRKIIISGVTGSSSSLYNTGQVPVTVTGETTFTYVMTGTPTTPAVLSNASKANVPSVANGCPVEYPIRGYEVAIHYNYRVNPTDNFAQLLLDSDMYLKNDTNWLTKTRGLTLHGNYGDGVSDKVKTMVIENVIKPHLNGNVGLLGMDTDGQLKRLR